jgi:hypothetical protein
MENDPGAKSKHVVVAHIIPKVTRKLRKKRGVLGFPPMHKESVRMVLNSKETQQYDRVGGDN